MKWIPLLVFGMALCCVPAMSQANCGETSQSSIDNGNQNIPFATPCLTGSGAAGYAVSTIYYWVGTPVSSSFDLGVFMNSAGSPGTLLCHASTGTITPVSGWNSVSISGCGALSPNTVYWIGYITSSNSNEQGVVSGSCAGASAGTVYANSSAGSTALPGTFPANTGTGACYSMYMVTTPLPVWSSWNGISVGGGAGNVNSLNSSSIGGATGNYNSWNGLVSPSSYSVLGNQATGTTLFCGYESICIVPILTQSGAGGYLLSSFNVNVSAVGGQIIAGLYSAGTTKCPSGVSFCPAALLCSTSAMTAATGVNTIPAASFSGCPTLTPNTYYFLAVSTSNSSTYLNAEAGSYCPGTQYFELTTTGLSSFALPNPMSSAGTMSEPSAHNCPAIYASLSCVGGCGTASVPWAIFTYTGNASGATVSTTNLATGAYCLNGTFGGSLSASTTYQSGTVHALAATPSCNGMAEASGSLSIQRTVTATDFWQYIIVADSGGSPTTVHGFWIYNTGNTEGSSNSQFDIGETDAGDTLTVGSYGGTSSGHCSGSLAPPCFKVERSIGTTSYWGDIPFSQNTWYFAVIYYISGGPHQIAVFNTSGVAQTNYLNNCPGSTTTICVTSTNTGNPVGFKMLDDGSEASSAGTWYYGPVLWDPLGTTFSTIGTTYGDVFFPDSPKVIGPTLAAQVQSGSIQRAELIHGRWFSHALNTYLD